jgi:hypothetical protein
LWGIGLPYRRRHGMVADGGVEALPASAPLTSDALSSENPW